MRTNINKPRFTFKNFWRKIRGLEPKTRISLAWLAALVIFIAATTPWALLVVFLILGTGASITNVVWEICAYLNHHNKESNR